MQRSRPSGHQPSGARPITFQETTTPSTELRHPQVAFTEAIKAGVLSDDARSERFAGRYMYMHTERFRWNGGTRDCCRHAFKHIETRRYIFAPAPKRAA